MKTPDEIKKGLDECTRLGGCAACPYFVDHTMAQCTPKLAADALAYIQQLEAKIPQWISVEERLPRTDEQVLLITNQGAYRIGKYSYTGKERAVWFRCGKSAIPCRWWMPLPEPPKEEV